MPITWCYEVADSQKKYCSTGFPIGCSVTDAGQPKDACVISVSYVLIFLLFCYCNVDVLEALEFLFIIQYDNMMMIRFLYCFL